jgi:hypothetical protein
MPEELREDALYFAQKTGDQKRPELLLQDSAKAEAAMYLAETGDKKWLPVLLDAAKRFANDRDYVAAAAKLGGEEVVPKLVAIANGPDRDFAAIAVTAMGSTGSRSAVPYLLEYLKSPDPHIPERANDSLQWLTHRRASAGMKVATSAEYPKWSRWWSREGATAPVYKAADPLCGPFQPLP